MREGLEPTTTCLEDMPVPAAGGDAQGTGTAWMQWLQHRLVTAACSEVHKRATETIYGTQFLSSPGSKER